MTIEQQIQQAVKDIFTATLLLSGLDGVKVYAEKLDDVPEEESFPAITIATSTPIPKGQQSRMVDLPVFVSAMVYLSADATDAEARQEFAEINEVIFRTLYQTTEWGDGPAVEINAMVIEGSEEPSIDGNILSQRTTCTAAACIIPEVES